MQDCLTEEAMCIGYVAGLVEGWKEGHEHGVEAAQFPDGWPQDEKNALTALPVKQLQVATAAMKVDVPCIPDYVTIGQERDILVKYIRERKKTNPFHRYRNDTPHHVARVSASVPLHLATQVGCSAH